MSTVKHRFYVPSDLISGDRIVFPIEEARHAFKVLRLVVGNEVTVIDGVGGTYIAQMEVMTGKGAIGKIVKKDVDVAEPDYFVHVGVGILKQASRWETFLEKAVELGASRITPLLTSRTQKIKFNERRAEAILIAALKQSGRSRLPILDRPMTLSALFEHTTQLEAKLICHEASVDAQRLVSALESHPKSVGILVGPEGGFSDEEIVLAKAHEWTEVWLGERRLRTETAAMASLSVITQMLDEK